jgi:uncharacterized protein YecE (DUF72 family)
VSTPLFIGCAGWSLPRAQWSEFPSDGTHLQRYAGRLHAVEINSSFYRAHQPATYRKWAESVPAHFHFSVKVPKQITHIHRLTQCETLLTGFLSECLHLGEKLGCLLVQLPPSLAFKASEVHLFLDDLRHQYDGPLVIEPRHESWLDDPAQEMLIRYRVGQVSADPSPITAGDRPRGWPGTVYFRLHGSPEIYHSSYSPPYLTALAYQLHDYERQNIPAWCIFDNTASGAAVPNALDLLELMGKH